MVWPPYTAARTVLGVSGEEDAYLLRLGATVRLIRKRLLGLNQEGLGARVGRDKNTISRWENGKTSLSAHDLVQLWTALGVPADWLLDPTDSLSELEMRVASLQRAASEAARDDVGEGTDPPSGDGRRPPPGRH